jgi:hypothetical protein
VFIVKRASHGMVRLLLWLGSFAITLSSLVYFRFDEYAPFLIEKLPLPLEKFYVLVLRLHVAAAALALPGCLLLTSNRLLKLAPRFHRYCGRLTGGLVLLLLTPTGFYLAFFARGGRGATLGFLLTGGIVLWAMVQAIRAARARRYASHRRFGLHVVGQLSVAVTSRAMLLVLESSNMDPDLAYQVSLWIPVLGTFALVECLVSPNTLSTINRRIYERIVQPAGSPYRPGADPGPIVPSPVVGGFGPSRPLGGVGGSG